MLQVLAESLVLALGGGLLGLLLSWGVLRWVKTLTSDSLPRLSDVAVDGSMLVFLLSVAGLVTVAFGLRPVLHIERHGGVEDLLSASRREYNTIRPHSSLRYRPPAPEALRPDPFFLNLPKLNGPHPRLQEALGLTQ